MNMSKHGNENSEEEEEEIVTCGLCHRWLSKPKCLPCLHSFCESCITSNSLETKTDDNEMNSFFNCPLCDYRVTILGKKSSAESWIKMLPTNRLLINLTKKLSLDRAKLCDPCRRGDQGVSAVSWCKDCGEALCDQCSAYHKRVKLLMEHDVCPLDGVCNYPPKMAEAEENCPKHRGKHVEAVCLNHDELCCVDCVTYDHDACKMVLPVTDAVEDIRKSNYLKGVIEKLKTVNKHLVSVIQNCAANENELEMQKERFLEEIVVIRETIVNHLKSMEDELRQEIDNTHSALKAQLNRQSREFKFLNNSINNGEKLLRASVMYGTNDHVFITAHKVKKLSEEHERHLKLTSNQIYHYTYETKIDEVIERFCDRVSKLGHVNIKKEPTNIVPTFTKDMVAAKLGDINGRSQTDLVNPWFTGGLFLQNGTLVLVDFRNKKLKSFDTMDNLLDEIPFDHPPWGVAQTGPNELLVTTPDIPEASVMSINNEFEIVPSADKLPVCTGCHDVRCYNGLLIFACSSEVRIMTKCGTTERILKLADRGTRYSQIASNDRICYTSKMSLVSTGHMESGDIGFTYSNKLLKSPRGFAIDHENNFYVCGMDSHNVHQVSPDGSLIKLLLEQNDGIRNPNAIAFEPNTTKFFVTQMDCDFIKMFRLITDWQS